MMQAKDVLQRVVDLLQDDANVRWTVRELVQWLNDGQRAVQVARPDATSVTAVASLAAGPRQDLKLMGLTPKPATLMGIIRNAAPTSNGRPVRLTSQALLDTQLPGWYGATPNVSAQNYTFDPRESTEFYVYPPAPVPSVVAPVVPPAQLEVKYSAYPVDVTLPTPGATLADLTAEIFLSDSYVSPLVDYILYRAYSKDTEFAGNVAVAGSYFNAFNSALATEVAATVAVSPKTGANA
jgi:hypothetical protein